MALAVASYNVLADAYVRPERYPGVPLASLDFMTREPALNPASAHLVSSATAEL